MRTTELDDRSRDIAARLKGETEQLHRSLDATVEPMLADLGRYQSLLAGLRDAYLVIERELEGHVAALARAGYDLGERSKIGWLEDDLKAIGGGGRVANPGRYSLPDATTAFGAVYVVEGASLGGQVIARRIIPALALAPNRGCRFFSGYGADTGDRWRDTRDSIAAHLRSVDASDAVDAMIAGAKRTFSLIDSALHARWPS